MIELLPLSLSMLALALVIGSVDALYFHLWRYRLYARKTSRLEHLLHTGRAVLLPLTLWIGFVPSRTTTALVFFVAVELLDFALMIWDVSIENKSRADLGGLSRSEYLVHIVATTVHSGAIALAFVTWPFAMWMGREAPTLTPPESIVSITLAMISVAVVMAVLHIALLHPRFVSSHSHVA